MVIASDVPRARSRTSRILLVEPHDDTRALYRDMLAATGCDIIEATNGREALVNSFVHRPELIATELGLPLLDGYALCEILRRDQSTAAVPILIVTIEGRETALERARKAGADAVMVKPVTPEALLEQVRTLLDRPRAPQASDTPRAQKNTTALYSPETLTPPAKPPIMYCPTCDRPLTYVRSHVSGAGTRHREQWDEYRCPEACGAFEYRHRTRKLRPAG
jgi:CheY-like chemotaxis protein